MNSVRVESWSLQLQSVDFGPKVPFDAFSFVLLCLKEGDQGGAKVTSDE